MTDLNYSLGDEFVDTTENWCDAVSDAFDAARYLTTFSRREIEQFQSYQFMLRSIVRGINSMMNAADEREHGSDNVVMFPNRRTNHENA